MINFSKEQIDYMKSIGLNHINFANLSDDDDDEWLDIEETVEDRLVYAGFDEDYKPNEEGLMCYSIIDMLTVD